MSLLHFRTQAHLPELELELDPPALDAGRSADEADYAEEHAREALAAEMAALRAAAPQHGKPLPEKTTHAVGAAGKPPVAKKMGILGTIQDGGPGPHHPGSSALAAQSLSLPSSMAAADGSVSGVLQLDAETALPYTVVDFSMSPDGTDCDS